MEFEVFIQRIRFTNKSALAVLILIAGACVGCDGAPHVDGGNSSVTPKDQDSPFGTLNQLRSSLVNTNEALFLRCFSETNSSELCLRQVFWTIQATYRLMDAVKDKYGNDAWIDFQSSARELGGRPKLVPKAIPTDEDYWKALQVQVLGSQATFYNPVTQMTNRMTKSHGIWKVDTRSALGNDVDFVALAAYIKGTRGAIEEVTSELRTRNIAINEIGADIFERAAQKRKK
jgi:hypothetical protein